jgi:hypothetical protein
MLFNLAAPGGVVAVPIGVLGLVSGLWFLSENSFFLFTLPIIFLRSPLFSSSLLPLIC